MEGLGYILVAAIVTIAICKVIGTVQTVKMLMLQQRGNELYADNIRVATYGK